MQMQNLNYIPAVRRISRGKQLELKVNAQAFEKQRCKQTNSQFNGASRRGTSASLCLLFQIIQIRLELWSTYSSAANKADQDGSLFNLSCSETQSCTSIKLHFPPSNSHRNPPPSQTPHRPKLHLYLGSDWPSPRLHFLQHLEKEEEFKKEGKHLCSALQSGVELAWASISPQTAFSFYLFVELSLCTAVREQRNHKDMHKLSHKKGEEKEFHF